MQPELSILKAFLSYDIWERFSPQLQTKDFPEDLQTLYRCLDSFHKTQNEEKASLHVLDLASSFFAQNKNNKEFYQGVFNTLESYTPNLNAVKELVTSIKRNRLLKEISITSYEVEQGKKPYEELQKLLSALGQEVGEAETEEESPYITDDLSSLLQSTYSEKGLRWRLDGLNKSLGSLRRGDFGFLFARPETGKTTFLASEVTFMAAQASRPVLWINNEEVNEKVKTRIFQAALGVTLQELMSNTPKYEEKYKKMLGGKILLPNQASYSKWDIEKIVKKIQPSLIVLDQIDKITGFDNDRDDLKLGAIYQWARELAKNNCPVIAVCQADSSAEGKKWLTMQHVANAKTSKQAEADFILGIGKIHDTGWEKVRFMCLSKNKLSGDSDSLPEMRHGKFECLINAPVARYENME